MEIPVIARPMPRPNLCGGVAAAMSGRSFEYKAPPKNISVTTSSNSCVVS
ncbi:hypothetical protein [Desulfitobacterium sp.]|nr:hypothetical protein [Desulfitobacterium sp.]HVJ48311.1 hypothetical protein [Desulfitobacterium sp.]